jgi:hypothetical protein
MPIQPNTKVVQADFGGQSSLKSRQLMRTLTCQAKRLEQFVVDRFNDLSQARQPTPQGLILFQERGGMLK